MKSFSKTAVQASSQEQQSANLIASCPFLAQLTPEERHIIQLNGRERHLGKGACFFLAGEPATAFYILLTGEVKLTQTTPDGQKVIIHYVRPGEGFGIIVVLSRMDYPVTAEAVVDCTALSWNRSTVKTLMLQFPQLAINGLDLVAGRFMLLQQRVQELATQRVEQRIGHTILRLVRQFGHRVETGVLIDMPLTHQDIAEMSGTTIYTVSRTLRKWEQEGIVENGRQRLVLCQPHQLVLVAEGKR